MTVAAGVRAVFGAIIMRAKGVVDTTPSRAEVQ